MDLKHIENHSLRNLVSVVPQKIDLFAGNIIDTIVVLDNGKVIEQGNHEESHNKKGHYYHLRKQQTMH